MEPGRDQGRQEAAEPSEDMDVACDTGATSSGQNNLDNSELHAAPVEPVLSYPKPTHRHNTKKSPFSGARTPPKRGAPE